MEWGDEYYYCDECDENHKKVGENFVVSGADRTEEIDFGVCNDCESKLYFTQSGTDIYIRCSNCEKRECVMH
jgi:hypothetical protein